MRRLWKLVVVLVVAGLIVPMIGCGKGTAPGAQPYKIGMLASLSEYAGAMGRPEQQAWLLAVEDINAEGGVNGHLLEPIVYDDGTDNANAAVLARKLITQDKVLAIGRGLPSDVSLAAKVITEGEGVVLVTSSGDLGETLPPRNWSFAYVPDQCDQCGALYQFCKTMNVTKAGYLGDSTGLGTGAKDVLQKTASDFGITIVDYEQFNPGDADMTPQLTKIKAAGPQIIWIQGFDMASVIACEQAKVLRLDIPILVMVPTIVPSFLKAKPEALEGVFTLSTKGLVYWVLNATDPLRINNERLAIEVNQKYGRDMDIRDPILYDNVLIIAEALRIAGLTNEDLANLEAARTKVRDAMETINITGCFDSYQFDAAHRTVYPIRDRAIITIKNGQRTFDQWVSGEMWGQVLEVYLKKIGQT